MGLEWNQVYYYLLTLWPLVSERTIPTERPPLVDLVPTFVDRGVSRGQRGGSPTVVHSLLLLRPFIGLLYRPCMIDGDDCKAISGMNELQGKPRYSEETCRSVALTTDPT
jgi:hypothetical protein